MLLSSEAQKKLCPILEIKNPGLCLGHMCMGWETHEEIKIDKDIVEACYLHSYQLHEVKFSKPSTIAIIIKNGKLLKIKENEFGEREEIEITHQEIMNDLDEKGMRKWLRIVANRKPDLFDREGLRNIQYNVEDQLWYHIFDKPTIDFKGKCKLM